MTQSKAVGVEPGRLDSGIGLMMELRFVNRLEELHKGQEESPCDFEGHQVQRWGY